MRRRRPPFPALPAFPVLPALIAMLGLLAVPGCAANGGGGGPEEAEAGSRTETEPPFRAANAVVVLFEGEPDTLRFRLAPEWSRRGVGTDTVMGFARSPAAEPWTAFGHVRGDSLSWGLSRFSGDMGIQLRLEGALTAEGSRGCGYFPHITRRRDGSGSSAAFALAPEGRPAPTLADVPVERCRSR